MSDYSRRAKAPPAHTSWKGWGDPERSRAGGASTRYEATIGGRALEAKLESVLGSAEWVDDLLVECGYPATGEPQFPARPGDVQEDDPCE